MQDRAVVTMECSRNLYVIYHMVQFSVTLTPDIDFKVMIFFDV